MKGRFAENNISAYQYLEAIFDKYNDIIKPLSCIGIDCFKQQASDIIDTGDKRKLAYFEEKFDHVKYKLGCYTKGQIIEKAIDSGFLFYIPERFLRY